VYRIDLLVSGMRVVASQPGALHPLAELVHVESEAKPLLSLYVGHWTKCRRPQRHEHATGFRAVQRWRVRDPVPRQ
jgi:hypothetical protein